MASVLCIAGLDPSGHAGLSADIRALEFLGVKPLPVASVLTVQNSKSFSEFQPVPIDIIKKQITAILEDEKPRAAKLGILGTAEIANYVSEVLSEAEIPFVTDPVLSSSTGYSLVDEELIDAMLVESIEFSGKQQLDGIRCGKTLGLKEFIVLAAKI